MDNLLFERALKEIYHCMNNYDVKAMIKIQNYG